MTFETTEADNIIPSTPSARDFQSIRTARIKQFEESNTSQYLVRYFGQTPPLFGTVDPDEIERLAGEKLNKGTHTFL